MSRMETTIPVKISHSRIGALKVLQLFYGSWKCRKMPENPGMVWKSWKCCKSAFTFRIVKILHGSEIRKILLRHFVKILHGVGIRKVLLRHFVKILHGVGIRKIFLRHFVKILHGGENPSVVEVTSGEANWISNKGDRFPMWATDLCSPTVVTMDGREWAEECTTLPDRKHHKFMLETGSERSKLPGLVVKCNKSTEMDIQSYSWNCNN